MDSTSVTAQKIRTLRKQSGLSQQQVAQALGIDRSAYTYFENGVTDIKMDRLIRLARLFGVGVDELLPEEWLSRSVAVNHNAASGGKLSAVGNQEKSLLAMFRQLDAEQKESLLQVLQEHCREL